MEIKIFPLRIGFILLLNFSILLARQISTYGNASSFYTESDLQHDLIQKVVHISLPLEAPDYNFGPLHSVARAKRDAIENTNVCELTERAVDYLRGSLKNLIDPRNNENIEHGDNKHACYVKYSEFHKILEKLNRSLDLDYKLKLIDNDFMNGKLDFRGQITDLRRYVKNSMLQTNTSTNVALQVRYLLADTLQLKIKAERITQNIELQRKNATNIKVESCISQILTTDDIYNECESISELMNNNITVLRFIINSAYNGDLDRIPQVLTFMSQITNTTQIVISFEALIEELLINFHSHHPKVLEIYREIDQLLNSPNFRAKVSDRFRTRIMVLQNMLSDAIEYLIISWAEEGENNDFANISALARDCPSCLDLIVIYSSDWSILGRVVKSVYANNTNKISSILRLVTKLPQVSQKLECFETLIAEMTVNNDTNTPMIFALVHSLEQLMETGDYLEVNSSDIQTRGHDLHNSLSSKIPVVLDSWAYSISKNEFNVILKFAKKFPDAFKQVLSGVIKVAYADYNDIIKNILNFASRLSQLCIDFSVVPYSTLIHEMKNSKQLNSPILFVIDDGLLQLLALPRNLSTETTHSIQTLRKTVAQPIKAELAIWSGLISKFKFTPVDDFSIKYPKVFYRMMNTLISFSYASKPEMVIPILSFGLHLSTEPEQSLNCYHLLIEDMIKDKKLNSHLVFVVDYFIHLLLADIDLRHRESALQLLNSAISDAYETEVTKYSELITHRDTESMEKFAKLHPDPFTRIIDKLIRQTYSGVESNIYPIVMFIHKLENITQRTLSYVGLVNSMNENDTFETPMVLVIDEYLAYTTNNAQYFKSVSNHTKLEVSSIEDRLRSGPLKNVIFNWCKQIKLNVYQDITNFSVVYTKSFDRIYQHILNCLLTQNEENFFSMLAFAETLGGSSQTICYGTAADATISNDTLNKALIFVLQDHIQSVIENSKELSWEDFDKIDITLRKLSHPAEHLLNTWVAMMDENASTDYNIFESQPFRVLNQIIPRFVPAAFRNNLEYVLPILNLCDSLTQTQQRIKCFESLIVTMRENGKLNDPLVFVVDGYLDKVNARSAREGKSISTEQQLAVTGLKNTLVNACDEEINKWANSIATNEVSGVNSFVSKYPSTFDEMNEKLINRTFSLNPDKIESILCFAAKMADGFQSLTTYSNLVKIAQVSAASNSLATNRELAFVADEYRQRLKTHNRKIQNYSMVPSHVEILKSINLSACEREFKSWIYKAFDGGALVQFARIVPHEFERIIGLLVKIHYALNEARVTPVLKLGLRLEDLSQNLIVYRNLLDVADHDFNLVVIFEAVDYLGEVKGRLDYDNNTTITLTNELTQLERKSERLIEQEINKLAPMIANYIEDSSIELVVRNQAALDRVLTRIVKLAYSRNVEHIEPIVRFAHKLNEQQNVELYDTLVNEIMSDDQITSPLVLVIHQEVQDLFSNKARHLQIAHRNKLTSVIRDASNLSSIIIHQWALNIRDNRFDSILDFALKHEKATKTHLPELIDAIYLNDSNNVRLVLKFMKRFCDKDLIEVIYEHLLNKLKDTLNSELGIQLAYSIKQQYNFENQAALRGSQFEKWDLIKRSYPSGIQALMFNSNNKLCIFNLEHREYLYLTRKEMPGENRAVTQREIPTHNDGGGYWIPKFRADQTSFTLKNSNFATNFLSVSSGKVSVSHDMTSAAINWQLAPVRSISNGFYINNVHGYLTPVGNISSEHSLERGVVVSTQKYVWILTEPKRIKQSEYTCDSTL